MKNYYELLEIESAVSQGEIKKAYFKMVRKYPPDREPEKFKEIREAYETLSDEKSKQQYDQVLALPVFMRQSFLSAKEMLQQGNAKRAIATLKEIMRYQPEADFVKALLANAYLSDHSPGNAIKLLEELVKKYPRHGAYRGRLGAAYLVRGWHKKALKELEIALALDSDNIGTWISLAEAYGRGGDVKESLAVLDKALQVSSNEGFIPTLYYFYLIYIISALLFDVTGELKEKFDHVLEEAYKKALKNPDIQEELGRVFLHVANDAMEKEYTKLIPKILVYVPKLMTVDEEVQKVLDHMLFMADIGIAFQDFEYDEEFTEDFIHVVAIRILPKEAINASEEELRAELVMTEINLIENYRNYSKEIKKFKAYYPKLYARNENFWESLQNIKGRKERREKAEKEMKKLLKSGTFAKMMADEGELEDDEWFWEDEPLQQPVRRETPKIGRNDPCPCGSGKKYKHCCMK